MRAFLGAAGAWRYPLKQWRQSTEKSLSSVLTWKRPVSNASLPRIAQPSIVDSLVPKFLRQPRPKSQKSVSQKRKEWNPATFFIVAFLLIGSNAINMIALRNDFTAYSRNADAKIALLKEVLERVQKGEEVDVEGMLGTGDETKEQEWEEGPFLKYTSRNPPKFANVSIVLKEIENEDRLWQAAKGKQRKPQADENAVPKSETTTMQTAKVIEDANGQLEPAESGRRGPAFY